MHQQDTAAPGTWPPARPADATPADDGGQVAATNDVVPGAGVMYALAIIGTVLLVAAAFATSFTHLADVATRSRMPGGQAWTLPAMVDGAGIVATLAGIILPTKTGGRQYAWTVVTVMFGLSLIGNVLAYLIPYGPMPTVIGVTVWLLPPAAALVGLHLVVILGQWRATHRKVAAPVTTSAEVAATTRPVPAPAVVPAAPHAVGPAQARTPAAEPPTAGRQDVPADPAPSSATPEVAASSRRAGGPAPAISREAFAAWLDTWRAARGLTIDSRDEKGERPRPTYAEVAAAFEVREKTGGNAIIRHYTAEDERLNEATTAAADVDDDALPAREMVPA